LKPQAVLVRGSTVNPEQKTKCLGCGKLISGQPKLLKLKIVNGEDKLVDRAKSLGLTSLTWKEGDFFMAYYDRTCYKSAMQMWRVAFSTRLVSPRREL
jgi:hypothetical protein